MHYVHVDVFSPRPYSGNSLAVFPDSAGLSAGQMARITQEMRHFESVFLARDRIDENAGSQTWRARVFDLAEELDFAGHPLIGAACVLHALHGTADTETWRLRLTARTVGVTTERRAAGRYTSVLDQGPASFLGRPSIPDLASWFSLTADDLAAPLAALGARFAYLLDAAALEGRHWNNDGVLEDVDTGSGAGCAAAYLRRHGRITDGRTTVLRQDRFTGRPSELAISAYGGGENIRSVTVGGEVSFVAEGHLGELPT